jgi:putative spermidine/putrescine transport system ATP-binding protein
VQVLGTSIPVLPGSATGPGHALVRPESVSFTPASDGPATIVAVAFLGPVSRATATLPDGTLLVAQVDSAEAAALSVGDRVGVRIDPTPILVVAS